ncbi:lipoprotein-releasing ABC transporter permease subunit LolE [Shewanella salipaludis]|uniref:Lipoprotein-releasing ABC transporter permease subunit LolE n=1 Tax=Shewanella salipaludis TaxID=2723052 RepID=A0A972JH39_9GAMM|nr:lipoprotein-releasing ABC transporter permease subunit LolE [Shewanella salipaludis]NMH63593.1 lipoprotein-releasing ABC transporter permease subunit LolE [Shewanella salipaludis]
MRGTLPLAIGWRFYRARQANSFISFISFASTAGIALGVAVLILVLSAMNGFERELEQRLLGVVSHGELTGVNEPLHDWQKTVADAAHIQGISAAAPFIQLQGLVQKPGGFQGLSIVGIDIAEEAKVSTLADYMTPASWQSLATDENHIVLGQGLLDKLGLEVGDILALYMPNKTAEQGGSLGAAKSHRFVISGSYRLGGELELSTAYIPLRYAAELLQMDGVSGVRIKVDKVFDAPGLIRELGYSQDQYLYISDWTRTQGHLYQDIQLVRTVMYLVLALVIAVACFNIVSTLVMAVRDKASEIAILMTMGLDRTAIMTIFMVQGALNGLLGCAFGGLIGVALALNLSSFASGLERLFGMTFLSADVYFIDFLPSQLQWPDAALVITMAFVMSLLATLYPAFKASQIAPATALAGR